MDAAAALGLAPWNDALLLMCIQASCPMILYFTVK
jgi:hypothetical protein